MVKLVIGNSECEVSGLSIEQMRQIRDIMSYEIPANQAFHSGSLHSRKRYLIDKKGRFPSGLAYLAINFLKDIQYDVIDSRTCPKASRSLFTMTSRHLPYKHQAEASRAILKSPRGIIVAPTGTGKSLIIAMMIHNQQVPTLIVVPNLALKRQLIETLSNLFTSQKVGTLRDKKPIAVENVDSLDPNKLLIGYDCVIIDEFHHSAAESYRKLNKKSWTNVFYRYGLTATPFRSQDHERLLLESVISKVIYKIDYKTAIENKYIVPLEAYYVEVPKTKVEGYTWSQVYNELIVNNKKRNELILHFIIQLNLLKKSSITLVKEIKHGENIAQLLNNTGVFDFHYVKGENDNNAELLQQFNDFEYSTLIGTTGVIGEGVDTKPAEYVIIAGLGKSKNSFMQQCGRAFRKSPGKESAKILIFLDKSHKWTIAHFKEQCKILKEEYGIIPERLDI